MGFLTDVVDRVRRELERVPLDEGRLEDAAAAAPPPLHLADALRRSSERAGIAVIAEVKRASPSAGAIAARDAGEQARTYERAGAAAISVLTEGRHFAGSLDDLRAVRAAVGVPVLRKDFVVAPAQLLEARAYGADAALLIAAALDDAELRDLLQAAADLGLSPLVETHSERDLERALATDAEVIGVNARDLETLEVDPTTALARLGLIPEDRVAVLESGIAERRHVEAAAAAGARAVLVGEALMRADDPGAKLRELIGKEAA